MPDARWEVGTSGRRRARGNRLVRRGAASSPTLGFEKRPRYRKSKNNISKRFCPSFGLHISQPSRGSRLGTMHAVLVVVISVAALLPYDAIVPTRAPTGAHAAIRTAAPSMGLFDGLKGAFANDDTLSKQENAGLTKEKTKRTVTWVGPGGKTKQSIVVPGQRLKDVARASGIPIKYDCNEGTCKTCEAKMAGGVIKVCVAKAPDKDVTITYGLRQ